MFTLFSLARGFPALPFPAFFRVVIPLGGVCF